METWPDGARYEGELIAQQLVSFRNFKTIFL